MYYRQAIKIILKAVKSTSNWIHEATELKWDHIPIREWKYSRQHRHERWEHIQQDGKSRTVPSKLSKGSVSQTRDPGNNPPSAQPQSLVKRAQDCQQKQLLSLLVQSRQGAEANSLKNKQKSVFEFGQKLVRKDQEIINSRNSNKQDN